jgi:hypothetical protein
MYDEYKLTSKWMWKPVHEFPKSTVGMYVLFLILEKFEKVPKYLPAGARAHEANIKCCCFMVYVIFIWCTK